MNHRSQKREISRFPVFMYKGITNLPVSKEEVSDAAISIISDALDNIFRNTKDVPGELTRDRVYLLKVSQQLPHGQSLGITVRVSSNVWRVPDDRRFVVVSVHAYGDPYGMYKYATIYRLLRMIQRKIGDEITLSVREREIDLSIMYAIRSDVSYADCKIYTDTQSITLYNGVSNRDERKSFLLAAKDVYRDVLSRLVENNKLLVYVYVDAPPEEYSPDAWEDFVRSALEESLGVSKKDIVISDYSAEVADDFTTWVLSELNNVAQEVLSSSSVGKKFLFIVVPTVEGDMLWPPSEYRRLYSGFFRLPILPSSALQVVRSALFLGQGHKPKIGSVWDQLPLEVGYKVSQLFGETVPVRVSLKKSFLDAESTNYILLSPIHGGDETTTVKGYAIYYRDLDGRSVVRFVKATIDSANESDAASDTTELLATKIADVLSKIRQRDETVILFSGSWKPHRVMELKDHLDSHGKTNIVRMYQVSPRLRAFPLINPKDFVTNVPYVLLSKYDMLVYPSAFFAVQYKSKLFHGEYSPLFVRLYYSKDNNSGLRNVNVRNTIISEVLYLVSRQAAYRFANSVGLHTLEIYKLTNNIVKKVGNDTLEELFEYRYVVPMYHFI